MGGARCALDTTPVAPLFRGRAALADDDLRRYAGDLHLDVALFDADRASDAVLGGCAATSAGVLAGDT